MLKVHKFSYYLMIGVFVLSLPTLVLAYLQQSTVPTWTMALLLAFVSGIFLIRERKSYKEASHVD